MQARRKVTNVDPGHIDDNPHKWHRPSSKDILEVKLPSTMIFMYVLAKAASGPRITKASWESLGMVEAEAGFS